MRNGPDLAEVRPVAVADSASPPVGLLSIQAIVNVIVDNLKLPELRSQQARDRAGRPVETVKETPVKHKAVNRRSVVIGIGAAAGAAATGGIALGAQAEETGATRAPSAPVSSAGSLAFDKDDYTELTTTITTDAGDKLVKYHFYKAVTYVTKPVDEKYQCLNVSVPVEIDGRTVDATRAPIVLANSVGGYMPSSVADAEGVGGGGMTGGPGGGAPSPSASSGAGSTDVASGGNAMVNARGGMVNLGELGLAAGYVVVEPGARGRTLTDSEGTYYGTAPAAIVDLKAAVRYVRANKGAIPGDTDRIVSTGTSAAWRPLLAARRVRRQPDLLLVPQGHRCRRRERRRLRHAAPGARSPTWNTPTARTSGTGAPTPRTRAHRSTRQCPRPSRPSTRSTRPHSSCAA